jgi:SmpA / OmlA family
MTLTWVSPQKKLRRLVLALLLCGLAACSKVTAENYQKIQSGMSRSQVVAILGEPSQTQRSSLLGVAGESAVWEAGKVKITATFVNETVLTHSLAQQ